MYVVPMSVCFPWMLQFSPPIQRHAGELWIQNVPFLGKWECEAVKTGCLPMYQSCDRLGTCLGCSTGGEAH